MTYFKIGDTDLSSYVNSLKITRTHTYNSQTNAAGDTIVDLINSKRVIEVGIIPIKDNIMTLILNMLNDFNVSLSYLNPETALLESGVNCIIPSHNIEYYTIQKNNVMYKAVMLKFIEL